MRAAVFAVIGSCLVFTGCAATSGVPAVTPSAASPMVPRPLMPRELPGLLLTGEQVNAAMGTTAMALTNTETAMADSSATMAPAQCLALDGAAEAAVYASSGVRAERDQTYTDGDHFTHYLKQAVISYPLVDQAAAFVDHSARQWPTCQHYVHLQS